MDAVYRHFNKTVLLLATALLMVVPGRAQTPSFVLNGSGAANLTIAAYTNQAVFVTVASSMAGTTEIAFTATATYSSGDQAWLSAWPAQSSHVSGTTPATLTFQINYSGPLVLSPAVITLTATSPSGVANATITVSYPGGGSGGPTITTTSLPYGIVGVPYSATLSATGGAPPYTWTLGTRPPYSPCGTSLPAGLGLNAGTGLISGTPSAANWDPIGPTPCLLFQVTDSKGTSATAILSLVIYSPLVIVTDSLPQGAVGTLYRQCITPSGGAIAFLAGGGSMPTITISSGSLPTGIVVPGFQTRQ